jgi:Kef-type K+ transport system membrane component KefB
VIIISRILALFLARLRQPRVISEVIGGIILGPSVLGQIPHFTESVIYITLLDVDYEDAYPTREILGNYSYIFPTASLPYLNVVANLGLILFLFLVGLETDFGVFKRNSKSSLSISFVGMVIPFGLGVAVAVGIYDKFIDTTKVSFGHFLLFIGVGS